MKPASAFFALAAACAAWAQPQRILVTDEGNANLALIDRAGGKQWTVPIPGNGRDLQLLGGDRVLTSSVEAGYCEFALSDGALLKKAQVVPGAQCARRLPNGHTVLAGDNLDGSKGIVVIELDEKDQRAGKAVFPGLTTLRLLRLTAAGHLLFGSQTKVIEGDMQGRILWQAEVPGATIYKALRLPGGNTWVTTGYTATLVLLDPQGKILKTLGQGLPSESHPRFFADFQLLPNGDFLVANWQNHGTGHGNEGWQLLQLDSTGALRWHLPPDAARFSSLHGALDLDGLDTRLPYDEREGRQTPWTITGLRARQAEGHGLLRAAARQGGIPFRYDGRILPFSACPASPCSPTSALRIGSSAP